MPAIRQERTATGMGRNGKGLLQNTRALACNRWPRNGSGMGSDNLSGPLWLLSPLHWTSPPALLWRLPVPHHPGPIPRPTGPESLILVAGLLSKQVTSDNVRIVQEERRRHVKQRFRLRGPGKEKGWTFLTQAPRTFTNF